jgi:hypothetical protein
MLRNFRRVEILIMSNNNITYIIVVCVIIVVFIMLVISVFNNQSYDGNVVYTPEPSSSKKPIILQHHNYTFTIDCNTMDMPNIVLYFNSYNITEYYLMYQKYVAYDYRYDCGQQKLWLDVFSEEYTLVGIDLKIRR